METKFGFHLMDIAEFGNWLAAQQVNRVITLIQNHHTYLPDYTHFTGKNHFERLQSMKHYHMVNNNWSNIAQTFTTFPDGKIAVCRPLNEVPIGIKGHNSRGICIEHFGNFDKDKDQMTPAHRDSILRMNALLCAKFNLPVDTDHIVYHHWYDLNSGQRLNGKGVTKTCPGTAFFGGNKVEDANTGFIPLVQAELNKTTNGSQPAPQPVHDAATSLSGVESGIVSAPTLNVRKGAGTGFPLAGTLSAGSTINIHESANGWLRISNSNEWVAERFVIRVRKARVLPNSLNVRTGPGAGFAKLGTIAKDEEVMVYETRNGFSRIDINEKWVASQFLS